MTPTRAGGCDVCGRPSRVLTPTGDRWRCLSCEIEDRRFNPDNVIGAGCAVLAAVVFTVGATVVVAELWSIVRG